MGLSEGAGDSTFSTKRMLSTLQTRNGTCRLSQGPALYIYVVESASAGLYAAEFQFFFTTTIVNPLNAFGILDCPILRCPGPWKWFKAIGYSSLRRYYTDASIVGNADRWTSADFSIIGLHVLGYRERYLERMCNTYHSDSDPARIGSNCKSSVACNDGFGLYDKWGSYWPSWFPFVAFVSSKQLVISWYTVMGKFMINATGESRGGFLHRYHASRLDVD
ncbi:hypothetical protein EUX98_g1366 [Antrodiella citrinella]|uniref:Uncharacterized protein n=1 Tax=Antrodiella citrinella TaxID=2447956 RepID=A0A4S4N1Q2_9APHY|nr:hypothetical protein EUX98_g1366 [Antrodiella citrinella]